MRTTYICQMVGERSREGDHINLPGGGAGFERVTRLRGVSSPETVQAALQQAPLGASARKPKGVT